MACLSYVLAVFLPPLGVLVAGASCGTVLLNVLLTLLGYVPGIVHAFIVIHDLRER